MQVKLGKKFLRNTYIANVVQLFCVTLSMNTCACRAA